MSRRLFWKHHFCPWSHSFACSLLAHPWLQSGPDTTHRCHVRPECDISMLSLKWLFLACNVSFHWAPPTVPSMYRHNVPVLVSTAHLQINWIFYFLFCTAPQCPLSPLPLWPFPSRFPISCVPCSTITQLLTDGVQAAEWDVIDISVLLASLRLLFRYWRVCLPAVCLLHLDGAAY